MADTHDDRPATRADINRLAQTLAQTLVQANAEQAAAALAGTQAELVAAEARTREVLRGDVARIRHDLTSRLDTALAGLDALVEDRDTRLLAVVFLTQVLLGVALALLHDVLT